MKIALIVPGGVDRSGEGRVIPALLWMIERLACLAEVHVFALRQEPAPGRWRLLGAEIHNTGRRLTGLRTLSAMLAEHRRRRFDVAHAYWAGGPGVVGAAFKVLTGTPFVLTLPGGDLCALRDIGYGGLLTLPGRARVKLALAAAGTVIVPSETMRTEAKAQGVDTRVVRFGVALDRWPPLGPRRRQPGAPLRLLHVADLNRVKDQETLLDAMAILSDRGVPFRLDQLGLDTLGGAVQRRARELGLAGQVRFHGHRPRDEVRRIIERADLLVMSSRHEGVPIASLEAAVAGVPTVGTAVGQIADWAPDTAVAVPVGDAKGLAAAIERLAGDDKERLRLASSAQADAARNDADAFVEALTSVYAQVAAGKRGVNAIRP